MQGTYCLQYKRLRAGETSAMSNFMKAGTAWRKRKMKSRYATVHLVDHGTEPDSDSVQMLDG